jgi:hypothetical protein
MTHESVFHGQSLLTELVVRVYGPKESPWELQHMARYDVPSIMHYTTVTYLDTPLGWVSVWQTEQPKGYDPDVLSGIRPPAPVPGAFVRCEACGHNQATEGRHNGLQLCKHCYDFRYGSMEVPS